MVSKEARQNFILRAIGENTIANQAELVDSLTDAGFSVTQASVSRDLHELGIVKRDGRYVLERPSRPAYGPISLVHSGDSLLVVRCLPGVASAIAVEIDKAALPGVAGTLAGDDTIFIAALSSSDRERIAEKLHDLIGAVDEI
ncbi:MAG: ArgR family transcriptional regulator [Acidobacteria bacterium OLB17]|nr:MAG: ArgR family transcriptional regulator [Acidobacteria bacterium OLB17]MCZ2392104.1 hypothetical protein [Acidobacteriota bacterium]